MPASCNSRTALVLALALVTVGGPAAATTPEPTTPTSQAAPAADPAPAPAPTSDPATADPQRPEPEQPTAPTPDPGAVTREDPRATSPDGPDGAAPEPAEGAVAAVALDVVAPEGLEIPDVDAPATDPEALAVGATQRDLAVRGQGAAERRATGLSALVQPAEEVVVGLTAPVATDTHDVVVVGATWEPTSADVRVDLRLLVDGTWTAWEALAVDGPGEDGEGRPGSEPYVVTGGEDVQVRLTTDDGSVPQGARLDVYGSDVTPQDVGLSGPGGAGSAVGVAALPVTADDDGAGEEGSGDGDDGEAPSIAAASTGTPMPTIRSRATWGAVAPSSAMDTGVVKGITLHHTAGSNSYTAAQVPSILRGIQSYHMGSRAWSDIGYNFLVDKYGGIWEGRSGGIYSTRKGVHAAEFNGITSGVSVVGNYVDAAVTPAIKTSLTALIAWKLSIHGVSATGTMTYGGKTFPTIVGHRDVPSASTACPGTYLIAYLPTLRTAAAQRQVFPRVHIQADVNGDTVPDALVSTGSGRTYLGAREPFAPGVRIGNGWNVMDLVVGSPPLKGGTTVDLLYREAATGRLSVYHGNGKGGFTGKTVWGYGWNAMSAIIAPGDWTGDGKNDLIAVERATGVMYLYRGDGKGNLHKQERIGQGWRGIRSVAAAGDLTGDGRMDLAAIVDATGEVLIYPGDGKGGFVPTLSLGTGFAAYDTVVGIGDVTGDGARDVMVRNGATGRMTTIAGDGRGRAASMTTWGSGWDKRGALVAAPNWNGNGRPVLITFDRATGLLYSYETNQSVRFTAGPALSVSGSTMHAVVGDVTGSGGASIISRSSTGGLFLTEATGNGTLRAPRQIGQGWNGMRQITTAGDFDNDGVPDLLALASDGTLYVYPFDPGGSGTLATPFVIGSKFTNYRVLGVGGWSRSTSSDVLAIDKTTGEMRWYTGNGRAALRGGTVIGTGWRNLDVSVLGDVTGSGHNDLMVRDSVTGARWLYPANGLGGFAPRRDVVGLPSQLGGLP